ncbi:MAG: hypothetical protein ACLQLO_12865 [Mycobacterium sp.]
MNGENTSHRTALVSAIDMAPQQLASTMITSGRTCAIARRRSSTSMTARWHSTSSVVLRTSKALRASQSRPAMASIRGSTASA